MGSTNKELKIKVQLLKTATKSLKKENRENRKKIDYITESRDCWRRKCGSEKCKIKELKRKNKLLETAKGAPITRHKYTKTMVELCVTTYLLGGCSFRGVVRTIECLRLILNLNIGEIPCKSSVENWVQKTGLYIYEHPDLPKYEEGYALIIDECMVIGQERMLVMLGIKASKEGSDALNLSDAEILLLEVRPSWSGEEITECIEKVASKMGKKAVYIICDGGSNLGKGIKAHGGLRIWDCGHEIARQTEHIYKDEERFKLFCAASGQAKFKEVMKATGYLTPPKQRLIARFMNLSRLIDWAKKVSKNIHSFNDQDQKAYEWIKDHHSIIEELSNVFEVSNKILKLLKNNGLSHQTIKKCQLICANFAKKAEGLSAKWLSKIENYLENELMKLPDVTTTWHISSDIIESLFGRFKAHKADNAMYGVTPFTLVLPVMTKIDPKKPIIHVDFTKALEGTFMTDLDTWNERHLIENQVIKRYEALKK